MEDPKSESPGTGHEEPVPPPTGTLFVMMLFLMLTAGMWGAVYLIFLER